jgi:Major tropism determinant N-terminal domain
VAEHNMANKIQLRRDTTANWNRVNPILDDGEPGLNIDTNQVKYGDGANVWANLSYASSGGVTFNADGMLELSGNLWVGTYKDGDSVLWADDTVSEYVGLWYGGERANVPGYGPNVSITVGNEPIDDNLGSSKWDDGLQINLDVDDKNWHFDAAGDITLPLAGNIHFGYGNAYIQSVMGFHIGSEEPVDINVNGSSWYFGTDGILTMPGDVNLPLVAKLNSGGIGVTNSAEFGTEVTLNSSNNISGSQIYMGAGTAESRAIVNNNGHSLMYTGVENPGFAGMVAVDPGVTSEYAIRVGANANIEIGAVVGPITTTEYVTGIGVLNNSYNMNGLFANSNVTVVGAGSHGWTFGSDGNLTLPAGGEIHSSAGTGPVAIQSNDGNNTYTWNFGTDGTLTLPTTVGGGNEGAEIDFTKAANSTLSGSSVIVDQYVDRIRFFEGGGTARGAYIDLSQAAAGVGTLLNNRVSAFVNAGTFVTMDNIKATVTTSSNRGLSLATVSGTATCFISGTYGMFGGATVGGSSAGVELTTTPSVSIFSWDFGSEGDTATYILNDGYTKSYRITMMIGGAFNNNMISIERLI